MVDNYIFRVLKFLLDAPESVTDKIFSNTTTISEYLIFEDLPDV